MPLCTEDLNLSTRVSAPKSPSAALGPGLPLASALPSHLIARPGSAFSSLTLISSFIALPASIPFSTLNSQVLGFLSFPVHPNCTNGAHFPQLQCLSAARPAEHWEFPPQRGGSVARMFLFSTLGVGRALRDPLTQHLPNHAPGSGIISYVGFSLAFQQCSAEAAWSNECGEFWVQGRQASSACSADLHSPQSGHAPITSVLCGVASHAWLLSP